jgi:hypothetical protein
MTTPHATSVSAAVSTSRGSTTRRLLLRCLRAFAETDPATVHCLVASLGVVPETLLLTYAQRSPEVRANPERGTEARP